MTARPPRPEPADPETGTRFGQTVLDDLSRTDSYRSIHRDLKDVYEFYLDERTRRQLDGMGRVSRPIHMVYWMLKNSILKLVPARRLLLLLSVLLFLEGALGTVDFALLVSGFVGLLLILLLELKDKLLAQDELAVGRAVQTALMPTDQPQLEGWQIWLYTRPANDVGGDLVDYLTVRENRLALALGDVAGKGLGAALVMAKLQATLRAIAPNFATLSELGTQINGIFCRDGLRERFVSLAYLEIEPEGDAVRVLNAGHLPPLVVRADGLEELPKGAPALGLMAGAAYQEQRVSVAPGDLVVVYSDGLTEARNGRGDFFGGSRLARLLPHLRELPAERAGERLLQAVDRFVGDARPSDDLSLILLRRTGTPSGPDPSAVSSRRPVNETERA